MNTYSLLVHLMHLNLEQKIRSLNSIDNQYIKPDNYTAVQSEKGVP